MSIARLSVAATLTLIAAAAIAFTASADRGALHPPSRTSAATTERGRYSADSSAALGSAQASPSPPADRALGATDAGWNAAHKLDTSEGRVLAYDPVAGLANGATDRFTEVTETDGRISYFALRLKPRTSIGRAIRLAQSVLPADATYGQLRSCDGHGMAVHSATLQAELGSPDAAIFFTSSGASFNPHAIIDAEIAAGETVVTDC